MAKRKKTMGAAAYFVRRTATHCKAGEKSERSFGPFRTYKEAQAKLDEDQEAAAPGTPQYEYDYRIEVVPTELLRSKDSK